MRRNCEKYYFIFSFILRETSVLVQTELRSVLRLSCSAGQNLNFFRYRALKCSRKYGGVYRKCVGAGVIGRKCVFDLYSSAN